MELKMVGNLGVPLVFCLAIHCLGTVQAKKVTEIEFYVDRNASFSDIEHTFLSCLCGADIPHSMSCNSRFNSTHRHQRYTHCEENYMLFGPFHIKCTMRTLRQCKKKEHHHCKSPYFPLNITDYCFDECVEMYYMFSVSFARIKQEPIQRKCRIRHTSDYHPRKRGRKNPLASEVRKMVRLIGSDSTLAWALVGIFSLALIIVSGLLAFVWWRGSSQRAKRASDMAMLFNRNDDRLPVANTGSAQG